MSLVNVHTILAREITFGKAQVMNGIKQICFSYTITATNTNNAFCKTELLMKVIFELIE